VESEALKTMVNSHVNSQVRSQDSARTENSDVRVPWLTLRTRRPAWSFKLDRRAPWVLGMTLLVAVALMIWNVGSGEYPIAPIDVIRTVLRMETGNSDYHFVVNILRLPRAIVAFVVGIMLALSGAVMQTLTRNPLASPDITGVTAGASMGAVMMILFWPNAGVGALPLAALGGGALVALAIYLLAWRHGDSPMRLILVGIGLGAMLSAFQAILMLRADIEQLQRALYWLTGSIYARTWEHLYALLPWFLVLVPVVLLSVRELNALHLGDEVAQGVGVTVTLQRGLLLLASVGLTGAAISQVGALGFVGLMAPHVARRLVGPAHEGSLVVTGLVGCWCWLPILWGGHSLRRLKSLPGSSSPSSAHPSLFS
jgi:iron complex transport system permease protein